MRRTLRSILVGLRLIATALGMAGVIFGDPWGISAVWYFGAVIISTIGLAILGWTAPLPTC